jgi:hypothetical protein
MVTLNVENGRRQFKIEVSNQKTDEKFGFLSSK